jgi:hypothetical protein
MRDEQDGFPLLGKRAHNTHQLVDFLRRQHRRRLVEDEVSLSDRAFSVFNALLHADRKKFSLTGRIDLSP